MEGVTLQSALERDALRRRFWITSWFVNSPARRPLYGDCLHLMPTAPVFVLRAECLHCGQPGFFVSQSIRAEDREARGLPNGRCAECRRSASRSRARG